MQSYRSKIALTAAAVAGMLASPRVRSQQPVAAARQLAAAPVSALGPIIREIDDPSTGRRWLLVRDTAHPGGPGRLLFVSGPRAATPASGKPASIAQSLLSPPITPARHVPDHSAPMIHAGDSLVVEENTPVVDARLTATALGPAARGAAFNARLTLGGRIVNVLALAPGHAAFLGAQP